MWPLALLLLLGVSLQPAQAQNYNELCQKDGKTLLIAEINGGLNNQRWVMLLHLLTAYKNNLAYYLAPLNLELFGECQGQVGFQPWHTLYSVDHILDFAMENGMTILTDLPGAVREHCCKGLQTARQLNKNPADDLGKWVSEPPPNEAVCLDYHLGFYELPRLYTDHFGWGSTEFTKFFLEVEEFNKFRPAIQPNPRLKASVDYILEQVEKRFGSPSFITVHVRVEDDWRNHCGAMAKPTGVRCYYKEVEIEKFLRVTYNVAPGTTVQVASGFPIKSMPKLCSTYRCFKATDIWRHSEFNTTLGPCVTREMLGAVEFWTAMHSNGFYGNLHSSFSGEMVAEMRRQNKVGVLYNEACEGDACV